MPAESALGIGNLQLWLKSCNIWNLRITTIIKGMACSGMALRKVSKGPWWKVDQIRMRQDLERPVKMLPEQLKNKEDLNQTREIGFKRRR